MVVFLIATIGISAIMVVLTGEFRYALSPIGVIPLWAMLHFRTPRDGTAVNTIRSTPGAVTMLCFCGATLVLMAILFAIDVYMLGHPFHAPLELYHLFMFGPLFILLLVGAYFAERAAKATRNQDS